MHLLRCITGDSGSLNSSAISNGLVGVGTLVGFLAIEEVRNELYDMGRVCHGYGKTRGFRVTGLAGTGMVPDLAYPHITAYPCHGITGMYGYITG